VASPSYLSVKDLTADRTREVLQLADRLKREVRAGAPHADPPSAGALAGKTLAMIFQKPSLRTRISFEVGMTQLGGHAIYLGPADIKLGERETVEDIALTISRMCDLIMARVFGHDSVAGLARHATVPVINALSDREHPCQILADLQTIHERKGRFEGLKAVFVGDGNNVAQSFLYGGALLGMSVTVACPRGYEPLAEIVADATAMGRQSGAAIAVSNDLVASCRGADVLYTDVWASMGQEAEAAKRKHDFSGWRIDGALLEVAKPDATILHCLPAHYGEEIDYAASRTPNSAIFDQAENRLHAQKALMLHLMGA
jgi:ornithine carbamoyltransferase